MKVRGVVNLAALAGLLCVWFTISLNVMQRGFVLMFTVLCIGLWAHATTPKRGNVNGPTDPEV